MEIDNLTAVRLNVAAEVTSRHLGDMVKKSPSNSITEGNIHDRSENRNHHHHQRRS